MNKISAVVFDLWNTLIPFSDELKSHTFQETTLALGVKPAAFKGVWSRTRIKRETEDLLTYFQWLRHEINADWSEETIQNAMNIRKKNHGSAFFTPDSDAVEVLKELKRKGYKLALISNCSSDVKEMISTSMISSYISDLILSAEVGIMKPDPKIFQYAATRLGLTCEQCVYIGDGHDNELEGAKQSGMHPILVDRGNEIKWEGDRIQRLSSLLQKVE
ncbi:HAD family hydrolase [Paenibacillus sp. PsM32]|uniref:HAD family hydrolase n=1 Tax=Paenibacillus sp. PsM32 TaxID=3030536 RepID=UPI00263B11C1|nr:HAD family hydrolase [Paenibacillus sp. PsM32]MDN4617918.1 HAD family hydrolase [Paenibacillus sp. PsM32]